MSDRAFVKSGTTSTPAVSSRAQVDKTLRRYGASAISMSEDIEKREIVVSFIIPDSAAKDAQKVPVKLPVSISQVYHAMYGMPTRSVARTPEEIAELKAANPDSWVSEWKSVHNPGGYDRKKMEQAERVAWRNLLLWIDAALSAATIGLQTITEAFFAHAVVGPSGERLIEVIEQQQASLGIGVQRLLTATTEPTDA